MPHIMKRNLVLRQNYHIILKIISTSANRTILKLKLVPENFFLYFEQRICTFVFSVGSLDHSGNYYSASSSPSQFFRVLLPHHIKLFQKISDFEGCCPTVREVVNYTISGSVHASMKVMPIINTMGEYSGNY